MAASAPEAGPGLATKGVRPIVAFDFDGTLTVRDTFGAFLLWRSTGGRRARAAATLIPAFISYALDRDRGRLKTAAFRALIGRVGAGQLAADAEGFADEAFDRLLRPDALARWRELQAAGQEVVIVTASPEIVIAPFARKLGADRLIGTRLRVDAEGQVDGTLDGPNCRGPEKVARLEAVYGAGMRLSAAYGDTRGDVEMLAIAERPGMRVFKERP